MLEAMACGTPVVAYHRGAVPEVVRHGETGFVVHSYQELKNCLKRVSDIEPERCREHVEQNFSRDAMVSSYLELYRSQVERKTPMVAG